MKETVLIITLFLTCYLGVARATEVEDVNVAGSFSPVGPPERPSRRSIGDSCIVDLDQVYALDGTLNGEMRINFRIYVAGPCGSPPGTFDEHWIAHGEYSVKAQEQEDYRGSLTYLADISAGGDVDGNMTFADGLQGSVAVKGNFQLRQMNYRGTLKFGSAKRDGLAPN